MDMVKIIAVALLQGFYDSIKGVYLIFSLDSEINKKNKDKSNEPPVENVPLRRSGSAKESTKKREESNVMKRVFQCCALNGGIFWLSIVIFEYGLLPGLRYLLTILFGEASGVGATIWSWMQPFLSITFGMIWVLPIFVLSKIVNSLWFQDIADSAFKCRKGRPQLIPSISKLIADTLFSLVVQALFLVQSMLVNFLPIRYLGSILCFVHMCLLYSLYSFEYKWFNMGWELHKRLSYIEHNWPYFLGFGMPLAILTQLPQSYIVSGCVFSIAFPIFILSGNEAIPVLGACEFPLKLFSPVVAVSNMFFNTSIRSPKVNVVAKTPNPSPVDRLRSSSSSIRGSAESPARRFSSNYSSISSSSSSHFGSTIR